MGRGRLAGHFSTGGGAAGRSNGDRDGGGAGRFRACLEMDTGTFRAGWLGSLPDISNGYRPHVPLRWDPPCGHVAHAFRLTPADPQPAAMGDGAVGRLQG